MTKLSIILLILLLSAALILRLIPIDFPSFTAEEARIAFRAYTLSKTGKDELSRSYPLLFNSLDDYKLPVTSYITAVGVTIFGKTDLGVRIPFILIGTALVFLVYQIAKSFSEKPLFRLTSSFIAASSPALIFLSKTPNEIIVSTFLLALLFYLLINNKNLSLIVGIFALIVITSKTAWFILLPFVFFTVIFFQKTNKRNILIAISALITILAVGSFLSIPQAKRSLLENNFSLFSDVTIKNGIDRLRGQGIESGWPAFIERVFFNKVHFVVTGFLHWLSHLNPAIYYGHFDEKGILNLSFVGVFLKVLIIPTILGLFYTIKKGNLKLRLLPFYFLILTFPSIFIYPIMSLELVILTIPFFSISIALGFMQLSKKIIAIILILLGLELTINLYKFSPEYKNTDSIRPVWIKNISRELFISSQQQPTFVSDDLAYDIVPFIEWYAPISQVANFSEISWPYKFRQYNLGDIKIIGSDARFHTCRKDEKNIIFASIRDLEKIKADHPIEIAKIYQDYKGENKAYLLVNSLCLN